MLRALALGSLVLGACTTALRFASPPAPPTDVPRPTILDVFPLEVGLTRQYRVDIRSEHVDGNETRITRWSGSVTETITDLHTEGDVWAFTSELRDAPSLTGNRVTTGDRSERYLAQGERISGNGLVTYMLFDWPLEVGHRWDVAGVSEAGQLVHYWEVKSVEGVETLAGRFDACYKLQQRGNVSDFFLWFCPGVGIARAEFQHFGADSRYFERWELARFEE